MKLMTAIALAATLLACAATPPAATTPASPPAPRASLAITLTTVYVDDQDKALRFYTEVLGFAKKDDVSRGPYRWLTVTAAGDDQGTQLQLARNDSPPARAYQEALFAQGQPATMLFTDDIEGAYARLRARGAEFTLPPTEVAPGSTITMFKDTCGNLIQITQLSR